MLEMEMDANKKRKLDDSSSSDLGDAVVELELDRDDVMKLLEPLDRESTLDILRHACMQHPDVLQEVRRYVDRDPAHRKLFVRGLGWDTTTETLKSVFSQYGELEEGVVIRDKGTQKSRGFGFVTFRHMDGAIRALKEPSKRIDGRMTVCQFAAWSPSVTQPVEDVSTRKIYVGNVPVGISADKVLSLFSQFGEIAEGPLGFDKSTGASKGFALIIYKTSEGARNALVEPYKSIDGHQVHCKLAMEGKQQGKAELDFANGQHFNRALMPGFPLNQGMNGAMNHTNQNQPAGANSFQSAYPAMMQVQPPSRVGYNYGSSSGVYGGQSAGYGSNPFYGSTTTSVALQSAGLQPGGGSHYGVSYPNGQQLTVPMGPRVQPVGGVPSLPSNYSS